MSFAHVPELVPCSYDDTSTDPSPSPPMVSSYLHRLHQHRALTMFPPDVLQPRQLPNLLLQPHNLPPIHRNAAPNNQLNRIHRPHPPTTGRPPTAALKHDSRQRNIFQHAHPPPSPEPRVPTRLSRTQRKTRPASRSRALGTRKQTPDPGQVVHRLGQHACAVEAGGKAVEK